MQNWEMNPVVIKNDRYKSAEIAYMEIQKYCKVKGYLLILLRLCLKCRDG